MPSTAPILDEDTAVRLRVALGRISRRLRPTTAGAAAGLTPTRISVLLRVVREDRIRLSELAASEGLNPTMLSRAISRLVDDGLIARDSDSGDRRAAWVRSTQAGRELAEHMRRERTAVLNEALEGLPQRDRRCLEKALPALEGLAAQLQGRHL